MQGVEKSFSSPLLLLVLLLLLLHWNVGRIKKEKRAENKRVLAFYRWSSEEPGVHAKSPSLITRGGGGRRSRRRRKRKETDCFIGLLVGLSFFPPPEKKKGERPEKREKIAFPHMNESSSGILIWLWLSLRTKSHHYVQLWRVNMEASSCIPSASS